MQTTNNVFSTFCSRDQSVHLNYNEYDLLRYCRLSVSRYFTENCANVLDTMMLTLFFFKPILPVGKLIGDIIGDLLGKY